MAAFAQSIDRRSPSVILIAPNAPERRPSSITRRSTPTMHGLLSCRATTAACEVRAPSAVTRAAASATAAMSLVSAVLQIRMALPALARTSATRAGSNTAAPTATPRPADVPRAMGAASAGTSSRSSLTASRSMPSRSASPWAGDSLCSRMRSCAMRIAASGVRLPGRHCSMSSRPSSTVNSKSCMSPNSLSSSAQASTSWR